METNRNLLQTIDFYWKPKETCWGSLIAIGNQPPAPNDRFQIEVQCKMLMSKFSPTSFDHTKTMLMLRFGSRWKVWSKYEIRGAHGSGGVGNGRNRDFGAPAARADWNGILKP